MDRLEKILDSLKHRIPAGVDVTKPIDWDAVNETARQEDREFKTNLMLRRIPERFRNAIPRNEVALEWLDDYVQDKSGQNLVISGVPKTGKGHPYGSLIATPTGYRAVETLTPGDQLIGSDGRAVALTAVHDRGVLPVFKVAFSDGASLTVDGDHLWTISKGDQVRTVPTSELGALAGGRWRIPLVRPVEFEARETAIHPYVLGVLLGDGHFRSRKGEVLLSTDPTTLARFESFLPDGVKLIPTGKDFRIVGRDGNPVLSELRRVGLGDAHAADKFVPDEYLVNDVDARTELLRGLMDTDGGLSRGVTEFDSASERLRDAVAWLVQSLGGVARKRYRAAPGYEYRGERRIGQPSYRLTISMPFSPFATRVGWTASPKSRSRIVKSVRPVGDAEVRCLSVDASDRLYVADGFVVTHNTWEASAVSIRLLRRFIPVTMIEVPDLMDELRPGGAESDHGAGLAGFKATPVLVLDDLGAEKSSDWTMEQLYSLINSRYKNLLPTIITTNLTYPEMEARYGERTVRRIVDDAKIVKLTERYRG